MPAWRTPSARRVKPCRRGFSTGYHWSMDRIHYAGDSVLTGSAIARALLEYAEVLAKAGTSATVDIPTREEDGSVGRSKFLIGPASQLVSDVEESEYEELVDDDLVEYFRAETAVLRQAPAVIPAGNEDQLPPIIDDL